MKCNVFISSAVTPRPFADLSVRDSTLQPSQPRSLYLMKPLLRRFACALFVLVFLAAPTLAAVETATGTVRGRILNVETGEYLPQARIRLKSAPGTGPAAAALETFSDDQGSYVLARVPAGPFVLEVYYTGLTAQSRTVAVPAGGEAQLDFKLTRAGEVIKLDAFVVSSSKEMSATALAVNSQRFSDNTKSVVAVDELGFIGDGSIAGAMKFLPGIDLEPDASGFSNGITLSGAPSANVPVTYGGFDVMTSADLVQNATGNQNQRSANLMQLSLSNISRIEINRSPTPDTPGSALAGSVNFVPKSAFERVRPSYTLQVYGTANQDKIRFGKSSGPMSDRVSQVYPGVNLSAIVPVTPNFGFSLTLEHSQNPKGFDRTLRFDTANWDLVNNRFQNTPNNPEHYMLYLYQENNVLSTYSRDSINLTADLRVARHGVLTASFTQSYNELLGGQRQAQWNLDRRSTSIDLVNSTVTSSQTVVPTPTTAAVTNNTYYTDFVDRNRQLQLKYRYRGRVWAGDLGASYGDAGRSSHDLDRGFTFSSLYTLTGTYIQLADIQPWGVGRPTASRNGAAVSPLDLRTFIPAGNFTSTVTGTSPVVTITSSLSPVRYKPYTTDDKKGQANGSVSRSFDFRIPLSLKLGFDVTDYTRSQSYDPTLGTNSGGFAYNGTDVSITQFLNTRYDVPMPNGLGAFTSVDNAKITQFYLANRDKFVQLNPGLDYQSAVMNSKYLHETISAGFVRFDSRLLQNRLWLVYGLRYERTTDEGKGPQNDPTGNYRRNAAGQFVNASGAVAPIGTTPALIYTSNSLDAVKATWFARGATAKRAYDNYFPSLNANYNVSENLVARLSYSNTIGRPDIYNIAPGLTLPNPNATAPVIALNNPGIKPWRSANLSASLEYYSKNLGDITLRGYRRFITDAFASQILRVAQAQSLLDLYGVSGDDYSAATTVQTLLSVPGRIVTSGLELSSRYDLDEFLPRWGRGFQVKLSATRSTITGGGPAAVAFAAQNLYLVPYSIGSGVSFSRPRFTVSVNGKWNATQRLAYVDPNADPNGPVEPGTYQYLNAALRVDLDATYNLTKSLSVFINGRDINTYKRDLLQYGPNTPDLLKGRQRDVYQPVWTLGLRARY